MLNIVSVAAALCDVVGAFLLAVEAMKIENFRKLRDLYLEPARQRMNPTIEFVEPIQGEKDDSRWFASFFIGLWASGAGILAMVVWFSPLHVATIAAWAREAILFPAWLTIIFLGIAFLLAALVTGAAIYTGIVGTMGGIIRWLGWIEKKTPTGFVAILGFLFFLVAFGLKLARDART
ncbi:MAG: hypothetical protein ABR586_02325 [Thermoplasmatota archaeon]